MVNFNCIKPVYILLVLGCFLHGVSRGQVLESETSIRIDRGEKVTTHRLLIQVNEKKDNYVSKVQIHHDPEEEFDLLEARVIDGNGNTVRKIKKKDIVTRSDLSYGTYYQDGLIEEFSMYWNQYPYQIEYSYQLTYPEFFWIAFWVPAEYMNWKSMKSSLRLEIPTDYGISMDYSENLAFEETFKDKKRVLTWRAGPYKPPKAEMYGPPVIELMPRVFITPTKFDYGVPGSSESWSALGQWQMDLNAGTDLLPAAERKVVENLVSGLDDPIEKVKALYEYLQEKTHYILVDIDKGGMKSYPASYVSQNKYGDCKALTSYMKALLKSIGIESYYTLINGDVNPIRVNTDFPSQQFNHAVLMVPMAKDTIWLENTSNSAPFNYLGTFTQDRYALVVDAENSRLVRTPRLMIEDVEDRRNFQFEAGEKGHWNFSFSGDLGGPMFENYRYYLKNASSEDLKSALSKDFVGKDFELNSWDFDEINQDNTHMNVSAEGNCTSQIQKIGSLHVISPERISIPELEKPERRKSSVRINFPVNRTNAFQYDLSQLPNIKNIHLQDPVNVSSEYGSYSLKYEIQGRVITVEESFVLNAGEYPLTQYKDFYNFIQKIKTHQKTYNILIQ